MSAAAYDALVQQLRAANVADEAAHREARRRYPDAATEQQAEVERRADVLEKDEQRAVVRMLREFGFTVRTLSQARASKQTPGLFDLFCTHRERPIAFWFDTKRQVGGKLSEAQQEFMADCRRCGVGAYAGDRYTVRTILITLGLAQIVGETLEPVGSRR